MKRKGVHLFTEHVLESLLVLCVLCSDQQGQCRVHLTDVDHSLTHEERRKGGGGEEIRSSIAHPP